MRSEFDSGSSSTSGPALGDPVLIVPGLRDSGPGHWQTLWQQRIPGAVRVHQERWDEPDLARWSGRVAEVLAQFSRPAWLVAHSFGCLAAVHALAATGAAVRGVFLVAPADPEKFHIADRLPQRPLALRGLIVGSLTDPWLSWQKAESWAARWQLPLVCAGAAGHINAESGHGHWREGWTLFQRLRLKGHARARTVQQLIPVAV